MNTETLRTFIAAAQIKNFTKTAEHLFIAQSTVTNRIVDLESEIGKPLFTRKHKQIELTEAGLQFLDYAKQPRRFGNNGFTNSPLFSFARRTPAYRYDQHYLRVPPATRSAKVDESQASKHDYIKHRSYDGDDRVFKKREPGYGLFLRFLLRRRLLVPSLLQ